MSLGSSPFVGGIFYGISADLLQQLRCEIPKFSESSALVEEQRVAAKCGDFTDIIGFHDGRSIRYELIVARPPTSPDLLCVAQKFGLDTPNTAKVRDAIEIGGQHLEWIHRVRRGYCGWLMTNREFLAEHDKLFKKHAAFVREFGCGVGRRSALSPKRARRAGYERRPDWIFRPMFNAFCDRWQLQGMAGPYLPVPFSPYSPMVSRSLLTARMMRTGVLMFFPHIFALPSEGELRSMIAQAQRFGRDAPHLADWLKLVSTGRSNKGRELAHYGRIFEIQHFLRLLNERHADALVNNKQRVMRAFAELFGHSDIDSIKADFRKIQAASIPNPLPSTCRV